MTQLQRIKKRLLERGMITRNECLNTFPRITRLGARIVDLKEEGWEFETEEKNNDYIYKVKVCPIKQYIPLMTQEGTVRLLEKTQ